MVDIRIIMHVTWIVADLDRSRCFYEEVLDLRPDDARPDLGYAGVWYNLGSGQQIHLMQLPNPDPLTGRPVHGGRDRHVALAVGDLDDIVAALERAGVPFTRSSSGRPALFTRDPDGNTFEFIGGM